MRITGGSRRGRTLITPDSDAIRPTADKTRLAVFNMLQSRGLIVDAVVIDAFCGTGALGIEAVSRGAAHAILIDKHASSLDLARRNVEALKLTAEITVMTGDATALPTRPASRLPATLMFLDPPYHKGLVTPALQSLSRGGWLADGSVTAVIETEKEWIPDLPADWAIETQKTYGISAVYIVTRA